MKTQYLEVVTPDVDAVCDAYAATGADFNEVVQALGNARVASLPDGSMIGVRAPMAESETPVARPYLLVSDIHSALARVEQAGGQIAHPPMELPGLGTFAIYMLGDVQHGFWQR